MQRSYFYTEFQDTYQVEESMSKTSAEAEKIKTIPFMIFAFQEFLLNIQSHTIAPTRYNLQLPLIRQPLPERDRLEWERLG